MQRLQTEAAAPTKPPLTFFVMPCNNDISEWMVCNYDDDCDFKYEGHVVEWSEGCVTRKIRIGGSLTQVPSMEVQTFPDNTIPREMLNLDYMDLNQLWQESGYPPTSWRLRTLCTRLPHFLQCGWICKVQTTLLNGHILTFLRIDICCKFIKILFFIFSYFVCYHASVAKLQQFKEKHKQNNMDFQLLMSWEQYIALPFAIKLWVVQSVSLGTIVSLLTLLRGTHNAYLCWKTKHKHNNMLLKTTGFLALLFIVVTNAALLGSFVTAFWPFGVVAFIASLCGKCTSNN